MSSIKPSDGGGEIDGAEEVRGALIVPRGNGAALFELGKEVLDQMACFVQVFIVCAGDCSVGFWRDDDGFACFAQRFNHPFIGIKGFVGNDRVCVHAGQQRVGTVKIMGLSWREMEAGRVAQRIAGGMYFCGQAALAAPDRLLRLIPPFAPAAC